MGGGTYCAVFSCSNSTYQKNKWKESICEEHKQLKKDCTCLEPFHLHRFPKGSPEKRLWLTAINRKHFPPSSCTRVCSDHFEEGKPTAAYPFPTRNLGYKASFKTRRPRGKRSHVPVANILVKKRKKEVLESVSNSFVSTSTTEDAELNCTNTDDSHSQDAVPEEITHVKSIDFGVFCDFPSFSYFKLTDQELKFYTGITRPVFKMILDDSLPNNTFLGCLSKEDQLLLILCKLRLALLYSDLAVRFSISASLANKIFTKGIQNLSKYLKRFVFWLPRETIRKTLPKCFYKKFSKTTCIIDCSGIQMQRPYDYYTRCLTYSNYKSRNTLKFLYAVAPSGFVMFVSECWGGRTSDNEITRRSGFYDCLSPGDVVMADRGFTMEADLTFYNAELIRPAFTKGKMQLSEKDVTQTRRIASVRIHVERAIGRLKTYRILQSTVPVKCLRLMDDILITCAALCNFGTPLIKES